MWLFFSDWYFFFISIFSNFNSFSSYKMFPTIFCSGKKLTTSPTPLTENKGGNEIDNKSILKRLNNSRILHARIMEKGISDKL